MKVTKEDDPSDVTFVTLYGPFEDWDMIEGMLGYDYGEEGSLFAATRNSK
jgi:hypothetical protein